MQTRFALDDSCHVSIDFRISGGRHFTNQDAIVDTGFFSNTVGLSLPRLMKPRGTHKPRGVVRLTNANGKARDYPFDPGVELVKLGSITLPSPVPLPAAFVTKGRILLGLNLLKRGTLHVDGPAGTATFDMP